MEQILINRLHSYILQNNPDLLLALQGTGKVTEYLEQKVQSAYPLLDQLISEEAAPFFIEEQCLDFLTQDLKPSKFLFLSAFMEKNFPLRYHQWKRTGMLIYEIANLETLLVDIFEDFQFSEDSENDTPFKYILFRKMQEYFQSAPITV